MNLEEKISELGDKLQKCGVKWDFRLDELDGFIKELREKVKHDFNKLLWIHMIPYKEWFWNLKNSTDKQLTKLKEEVGVLGNVEDAQWSEMFDIKEAMRGLSSIYEDMLEYIKEDYDDGIQIYERFIERIKKIKKQLTDGENSVSKRETVFKEASHERKKGNTKTPFQNSKLSSICTLKEQEKCYSYKSILCLSPKITTCMHGKSKLEQPSKPYLRPNADCPIFDICNYESKCADDDWKHCGIYLKHKPSVQDKLLGKDITLHYGKYKEKKEPTDDAEFDCPICNEGVMIGYYLHKTCWEDVRTDLKDLLEIIEKAKKGEILGDVDEDFFQFDIKEKYNLGGKNNAL